MPTIQRVYNFSAGPAVMPISVLEEIQRDLIALPGVGMSILEISHRSKVFESILAQAEIIDPAKLSGSKVVFGATVKLTDTDSGDETTYSIVGDYEADIKQQRIAVSAPLARAMIGREQGDTVTLKTGKGTREYQITQVRFEPQ